MCRYSTPLIVVMYCITQLLVEGTNLCSCSTWTGGMKEHHICLWCCTESAMMHVLAVTVHMIHDTKGNRHYLLVFSWAVLYVLFTVTSCEISTLIWKGILRRAGPLENLFVCSEAWSCTATTVDCLVLSDGAHWMRNIDKLRCLVFCSWWWVTVAATSLLMLFLQ